jgi:hypothetical protein
MYLYQSMWTIKILLTSFFLLYESNGLNKRISKDAQKGDSFRKNLILIVIMIEFIFYLNHRTYVFINNSLSNF